MLGNGDQLLVVHPTALDLNDDATSVTFHIPDGVEVVEFGVIPQGDAAGTASVRFDHKPSRASVVTGALGTVVKPGSDKEEVAICKQFAAPKYFGPGEITAVTTVEAGAALTGVIYLKVRPVLENPANLAAKELSA